MFVDCWAPLCSSVEALVVFSEMFMCNTNNYSFFLFDE